MPQLTCLLPDSPIAWNSWIVQALDFQRNDIFELFEEEFQCSPKDMFQSFNPEPVAAASLALVFKATTKDGKDVAVKVSRWIWFYQFPLCFQNLARVIRQYFHQLGNVEIDLCIWHITCEPQMTDCHSWYSGIELSCYAKIFNMICAVGCKYWQLPGYIHFSAL